MNAQDISDRMINVHYYYYKQKIENAQLKSKIVHDSVGMDTNMAADRDTKKFILMGPWCSLCHSTRVSVCHILVSIRTDQIMPLWSFGCWHHSHVFLQETPPTAVVAYNDDDDDDEEAEDMEAFEQSGMLEQVDKVGRLHVCVCVCM